MKRSSLVVALACSLLADVAMAAGVGDLAGRWREGRHGALVDIGDCGDGTPCGRLAWVDPGQTDGHQHDVRNPDPAMRARRLIGVPVLTGFVPGSDGWREGQLYNPDDGKTFRADLRLLSRTELRVTGCLRALPLCRSQVWIRADAVQGMRGQP